MRGEKRRNEGRQQVGWQAVPLPVPSSSVWRHGESPILLPSLQAGRYGRQRGRMQVSRRYRKLCVDGMEGHGGIGMVVAEEHVAPGEETRCGRER